MKKAFIVISLLFGFAIAAITYLKYTPYVDEPKSIDNAVPDSSHHRVMKFWKYYNRATDLRTGGSFREASEYYKKALELDPEHLNSLYYLGSMELIFSSYGAARDYWIRLVEVNRASARGHTQLGFLYSCRDSLNTFYDLYKAREHFEKAAQLNREITGPLLQLAKIDILIDNRKAALKKLNDVTASNFRSAEARFLQGYLYWKNELKDQAGKHLMEAIEITKGSDPRYSNVGEGQTNTGDNPLSINYDQCSLYTNVIKDLLKVSLKDTAIDQTNIYERFDRNVNSVS